nr:L-ascorbate oxidase-like [Aedes albopictus]XP_029736391.1 L-ascorbate oxidase-like [Aedes albopictus]
MMTMMLTCNKQRRGGRWGQLRAIVSLALLTATAVHGQLVSSDCDATKCPPSVDIPDTLLQVGERTGKQMVNCCEVTQIFCDRSTCPARIQFCDEARTIRPKTVEGRCCTLDECDNNATRSELCEVEINGTITKKQIGEKWFSMVNRTTCMNFECLRGEASEPFVNSIGITCNSQCPEGFALQYTTQHCCPQCVQAKCRFNDRFYAEDESWESPDGCQRYRCINEGGLLSIVSNRKQCPVMMDCPPEDVVEQDCCSMCNITLVKPVTPRPRKGIEYYDELDYSDHECKRECIRGRKPMNCYYRFKIEWYETLSKACYECPYNATDCDRPHCIAADGVRRSVIVINRMMPGPSIEVCENDIITVDVENHLMGDSTTIHWHGLHQKRTPYMDGVPHISQCPISPGTTFRYTFKADNAGTHFWHSHTGMQRGDGAFGPLIIRRDNDPQQIMYDHDLSEHVITVQDWGHVAGNQMFIAHHHSTGDNKPPNILINGRGKYFKRYPKITASAGAGNKGMGNDAELIQSSPSKGLKQVNARLSNTSLRRTKRQSRTVNFNAVVVPESEHIPLKVFYVEPKKRYRFRLINAEFLNCPVELSVEGHNLTVISSDSFDVNPVEDLASFVSYAGERFDFVLRANQPIGNYLMRFRGLMDCDERFTSAYQVAVLRYKGAPEVEYQQWPNYDFLLEGMQLNSLNKGTGHSDTMSIAETSSRDQEDLLLLREKTDFKFYVYYDFYAKDNPHFHVPDLYGFKDVINNTNRLFTPQLNHISMRMPKIPMMPGKDELDESRFCNASSLMEQGINCREEFCECSHVVQVPLNSTVEMVLIDEGFTFDANHPFHLHGHAFRVVGMERLAGNITAEEVKRLDGEGKIKRRLKGAPIKDTVTIPDGGYTIIRFIANNPGYWLFHCHIEFHAEIGMSLVLKVGDKSEMLAAPPNFPTCYDYTPGLGNQYSGGQHTAGHGALQRVVLFLASITVAVIAKMIA